MEDKNRWKTVENGRMRKENLETFIYIESNYKISKLWKKNFTPCGKFIFHPQFSTLKMY